MTIYSLDVQSSIKSGQTHDNSARSLRIAIWLQEKVLRLWDKMGLANSFTSIVFYFRVPGGVYGDGRSGALTSFPSPQHPTGWRCED